MIIAQLWEPKQDWMYAPLEVEFHRETVQQILNAFRSHYGNLECKTGISPKVYWQAKCGTRIALTGAGVKQIYGFRTRR